jgi:hypothetical protein
LLSLNQLVSLKSLRLLTLSIAWGGILSPSLSNAAEWSIKGFVDQFLSYDDNVRMRTPKAGSFEYKIIPTLTFLHKTDVSEIQANASYGTQVYSNPVFSQLNQDIQKYSFSGLYKTERIDWGMSWAYSIVPSRNTALQDSGNFNASSATDKWHVSPYLTYKISEIDSLNLAFSYGESSFSNSAGTGFRNNDTKDVQLTWQRLWTERYSSSVNAFYSNYFSQRGPGGLGSFGGVKSVSYDSVGVNFSNAYSWSENWKFNGTVGGRYTVSEANANNSSSFGFLANGAIEYTGESYSAGLHVGRSLAPSNQGALQELTSVDFNANYKITDNLSAGFDTGYHLSTLVNQGNQSTRETIVVNPSIRWNVLPELALVGSYRYRTQDRSGNGSAVNSFNTGISNSDSNLFMLSINYNWQGLMLSK